MGILNLPKPGHKFRTKDTYGSFRRKLKSITRQGDLKNLADNIPAITKSVKAYEKYIKMGGLSYRQKFTIMNRIKKVDKNLSKDDLREIGDILDHLGK